MKLHYPTFQDLRNGFLGLIYPELCVACCEEFVTPGHCFCAGCITTLPASDMYRHADNELTERFWGRLPLVSGAARYFFARKNPIQRALYNLKYKNQPEVGVQIGKEFGRRLREGQWAKDLAGIVPVPLHPRKERARGYNQSVVFAQGLSEALDVPILHQAVKKVIFTQTQTRKRRLDRYENVGESFTVYRPEQIEGRHILLVDDVLTTGATLESCGLEMLKVPGVSLSIATIAIRVHR
jgi:ComF family protein